MFTFESFSKQLKDFTAESNFLHVESAYAADRYSRTPADENCPNTRLLAMADSVEYFLFSVQGTGLPNPIKDLYHFLVLGQL